MYKSRSTSVLVGVSDNDTCVSGDAMVSVCMSR
jgi:hypothetical protein